MKFKFLSILKNVFVNIFNFSLIKKQIQTIPAKDELQSSIADSEKINIYLIDMHKKARYAFMYLVIIIIWLCLNIIFAKKFSWFVFFVQLYLFSMLGYYFAICKYRIYQAQMKNKNLEALSFKNWLKKIFNL